MTFMRKQKFTLGLLSLLFSLGLTSCNFFGKKEMDGANNPPGQLETGISIVGKWIYLAANTSTQRNPTVAISQAYSFDPLGGLKIEIKDLHSGGIRCTAFGQYRIVGTEVILYIQSADNDNCPTSAIERFSTVVVKSDYFKYNDSVSHQEVHLFKDRQPPQTIVGVWDFHSDGGVNGEAGIDFAVFDPYGYFMLQSTFQGEAYLMLGYYTISGNNLSFNFFKKMDPAQLDGNPMSFSQFITDGLVLQLVQLWASGQTTIYNGDRL